MTRRRFISPSQVLRWLAICALPFLLYAGVKVGQSRHREISVEELNHDVQETLPLIGTSAHIMFHPKNWSWGTGYGATRRWEEDNRIPFFDAKRDVRLRRRLNGQVGPGQPGDIVLVLPLWGDTADTVGQIQIDWLRPRSSIRGMALGDEGPDAARTKEFNDKLAPYELTPQSRMSILRRVEKQYSKQLRSLHIPPPQ